MADHDDLVPKSDTDQPAADELDAATDEELGTGPSDPHDPMSPHAVAPQIQDEEAEKADAVEEAAGAHPEPQAEEMVVTDVDSVKQVNSEENNHPKPKKESHGR